MREAPLRLLMTVDAVGGVWQYATELARALYPSGIETLLAVLGPSPTDEQRKVVEQMPGVDLVDTDLPLDWLSDAASTRLAAADIAAIARRERVDLVHLNSPALAAGQGYAVPVVGVVHGCLATWWDAARAGQPLEPAFQWHRDMMVQGLRSCDRVIAPSASFAETVRRVFTLTAMPQVVHNGRALQQTIGTGVPARSALTAGRLWDEVKNLRTLDAVAAQLSAPFHAAGDTRAPHGELAQARHLKLLGQLEGATLATRLAQRPVFVSAATFEPFGLAVLEAAGARCPLVLSDIPTFRELWNDAAIFVDAHDADGFTREIETILQNPVRREALGQAAYERAQRYTPDRMAGAMARHYRDVLAERLAA